MYFLHRRIHMKNKGLESSKVCADNADIQYYVNNDFSFSINRDYLWLSFISWAFHESQVEKHWTKDGCFVIVVIEVIVVILL